MSDVKKCDRCGDIIKGSNYVHLFDTDYVIDVELCRRCTRSFYEWMDEEIKDDDTAYWKNAVYGILDRIRGVFKDESNNRGNS